MIASEFQYLAHSTGANTALIKALAHLEQIGIKDNELIWKKPPHWPQHTHEAQTLLS